MVFGGDTLPCTAKCTCPLQIHCWRPSRERGLAELDNDSDFQNEYGVLEDLEDPMTDFFPVFPPTLHIPAQPTTSDSKLPLPLKSAQSIISLNSAYAPELRVVPPISRSCYSQARTSLGVGPSSGKQIVTIEEQFECPLCLDNETDIASLPCGHVYGVE